MAKPKSEFLSALGQMFEIWKALADAVLSRGGNDNHLRRIKTDKNLLKKIVDLILETVKNIFTLRVSSSRSTDEVVAAGKYDWENNTINSQNFPMRELPEGTVEIEFLEFDYDPTSEQVLAEVERRNKLNTEYTLERPMYEEALFFGEQYPQEQRKHPIVFLHEPWRDSVGGRRVVVLLEDASGRCLSLYWFDHGWFRRYRFAFVRKSRS